MDIDHLRSSAGLRQCPHKSHGNKNIERVNGYEEHKIVTDEIDPLPFLGVCLLLRCLNQFSFISTKHTPLLNYTFLHQILEQKVFDVLYYSFSNLHNF